jgi:glycosyltransferase involved in cell wall biosynthesis
MSKVTTIIPAFNAAEYIEQAVASALSQQGVDNEVIVIDDGSNDQTWDKLKSFGDRIRTSRESNRGPATARNRGAALANSEWLAFLDADDEWLPDKLVNQLSIADEQTGLVYTDRQHFGATGRVGERQPVPETRPKASLFEHLLLENFITTSSVLIRKSCFEQLGGFAKEPEPCEDWDLWLRYAIGNGKIAHYPKPLTRYRLHANSVSSNQKRMHVGRLTVLRRALHLAKGRPPSGSIVRHALANAWACSAWNASATQRWTAIGWYLRAASYRPDQLAYYKEMIKCLLRMA